MRIWHIGLMLGRERDLIEGGFESGEFVGWVIEGSTKVLFAKGF